MGAHQSPSWGKPSSTGALKTPTRRATLQGHPSARLARQAARQSLAAPTCRVFLTALYGATAEPPMRDPLPGGITGDRGIIRSPVSLLSDHRASGRLTHRRCRVFVSARKRAKLAPRQPGKCPALAATPCAAISRHSWSWAPSPVQFGQFPAMKNVDLVAARWCRTRPYCFSYCRTFPDAGR